MKNFKKLIKEAYLGNPLNEEETSKGAKKYFGVFRIGGSMGQGNEKLVYSFAKKEDAINRAKELRSRLTPGEKSHYGMRYVTRPTNVKPEPVNEETLKGAIEKEMKDNKGKFKTSFPTRDLRQILNTENPEDLPSSVKKVLDRLKKKYKINEGIEGTPQYYVKYTTQDGETAKSGFMSKREAIKKEEALVNSGVKKSAVYRIQKHVDLNGKPYTIDTELDKEIDYRKDEKGRPINEIESGDVVVYNHDDHTVQRIEDDELGVRIYIRPNERSYYGGRKDTFWVKPTDIETKEEFLDRMMRDQIQHDEETLRRERGLEETAGTFGDGVTKETKKKYAEKTKELYDDGEVKSDDFNQLGIEDKQKVIAAVTGPKLKDILSKSSSLIGRQGTRNFMDESEARINEIVKGDDFRFIDIKDLHFETDPDRLEDMKAAFGAKMGGVTNREMIEDAEYELRRFRKEIGFGNGSYSGVFLPGSYDAINSKLGDGPHAKKVPTPKWNERKYEQWIEDVASGGGAEFAYDMAQNAKMEAGLIDWVKKNRLGFGDVTPLERIQYDIEALAESVNEIGTGVPKSFRNLDDMSYKELVALKTATDYNKYNKENKAKLKAAIKRKAEEESINEVTQKEIDDIENSGNIDIAYEKAMKLLNSLKDTDGDDITIDPDTEFKVDLKHLVQKHKIEDVNEIVSRLPVEELTDEALTRLRDQFLTTGTRPNAAEMDLLKSVLDEMGKRGLEESINEGTCGYTPDGKPRSKPAGPYLNEDDIEEEVTIPGSTPNIEGDELIGNEDLAENILKKIFGPKLNADVVTTLSKEISDIIGRMTEKDLKSFNRDKIIAQELVKGSNTNPKDLLKSFIEEESDATNESKEFNFNKMIKEALTPNYLK